MQNIRYNPLFGTGDASSDAVNPVFGIARSNPLYGLNARSNEDTTPDLIAIQGLGDIWTRVVNASNFRQYEADEEFNKLNENYQNGILRELGDINDALNNADIDSAELQIQALAAALPSYFKGELTLEEELVGPPREAMGSEEELVGPPREAMQTPFQEYITDQGLEPSFNVMNILLGNQGKHLSPHQFNLAHEMQIQEVSDLVEGLETVMESEAVAFGDILDGEVDFTESARLQGMGVAMSAANTILSYFAQASTDQGPFRDLPPHASADGWQGVNAWQGVPNFEYGEYQGIAAAGYGTAAPVDFQGKLEAAWDVLAGHDISADEYDAMSSASKELILEYAEQYVRSGGRDSYAAEEMVNAAFMGLSDEAIDDVFDVPLTTSSADRVDVLRDGFSRVFPFYDVVDQPVYFLFQATISEIERATGIPVTANRLAEGLSVFRNVGFTSYRPDVLVSVLTNVCAKFANPDEIVMDVLSSDAFCSPERIANVQMLFGKATAQNFVEFCEMSVAERMVDIELNNFDIAQILNIRGSDVDALAVDQLNSQVASDPEPTLLVDDVRRVAAPEIVSPVRRTTVPKSDSKVAAFGDSGAKDPSKIAAVATIGITAVALGFLANKLRKL